MLDRMTQPENTCLGGCQSPAEHAAHSTPPIPLTRPGLGVLVDPERMAAARKSAMLERIELAHLSQALDLIKLATANGIKTGDQQDLLERPTLAVKTLTGMLTEAGVVTKKPGLRIGVSRDEIAKLESGGRKRPRITTLRKLIDALNYAREQRGKPPIDIEHLQVDGEVLIPGEQSPLDLYQEASNDIYYTSEANMDTDDRLGDDGSDPDPATE